MVLLGSYPAWINDLAILTFGKIDQHSHTWLPVNWIILPIHVIILAGSSQYHQKR